MSWLAGRVALPRPVALGTLGVRVMVERMVVRVREDEDSGKREEVVVEVAEGLREGGVEDRGSAAEEAGVKTGELRPDEQANLVPLAWVWF